MEGSARRHVMTWIRVALVAGAVAAATGAAAGDEDLVDLDGFRAGGDDWQVVGRTETAAETTLRLYHDKWLMWFLHWRPLTPERADLTAGYVRDLMLNFWGANMPFDLEGEGGEATVAGHPARYLDGTIYDGMVRTRFVVWNCPETDRQLIADCNINQRMNTPRTLLDLQLAMTAGVNCHGEEGPAPPPGCERREFARFGLSFPAPAHWRTAEFPAAPWFPEGQDETNGTLWTLTTEGMKLLIVSRREGAGAPDAEALRAWLSGCAGQELDLGAGGLLVVGEPVIAGVESRGAVVSADLEAPVVTRGKDGQEQEPETYVCRALGWSDGSCARFLLAGILAHAEVWNRPVDLRPSEETLARFVEDDVLPHVPAFPAPGAR
jgi:hypothetical protein